MRVRVELGRALARMGQAVGVDRAVLRSLAGQAHTAQADVQGAIDEESLVYLQHADGAGVADLVEWIGAHALVVLGTPGAVAAARTLATGVDVTWIASPDPAALRRAPAAGRRLLVLDGPGWVRIVANGIASSFDETLVIGGDGTLGDNWCPDGASRRDLPGAVDARFGAVGPVAQALAVREGADASELRSALVGMRARCLAPGVLDNPAWALAAVAVAMSEPGGRPRAVFLADPRLANIATVAAQSWTACPVKASTGPVRVPMAAPAGVLLLGDECATQGLVDGPGDAWIICLSADPGPNDLPLGAAGTAALTGRHLLETQLQVLHGGGLASINVRAGIADAADRAALALLLTHAAVAQAALLGVNPLSMPSADQWRDLQDAPLGDSRV